MTPMSPTALSEEWPDAEAYLATEFDVEERLGSKGTASMDRSSALAVGVTAELLDKVDIPGTVGVVLGTTSGSAQTQYEFTRDSLTRRKPYFVNPAVVPFALMNSAASQCAIWHGITGPNSTIAAGRLSRLKRVAVRRTPAGPEAGPMRWCAVPCRNTVRRGHGCNVIGRGTGLCVRALL